MFSVNVRGTEYKVRFRHAQDTVILFSPDNPRFVTSVGIETPEFPGNAHNKYSFAICHPSDNFCKNTGRKLALSRALRDFPREDRALFWAAYFAKLGKVK